MGEAGGEIKLESVGKENGKLFGTLVEVKVENSVFTSLDFGL